MTRLATWSLLFKAVTCTAVVVVSLAVSRADADEIDRIIDVFRAGQDIPGVGVYVRKDGKLLKQKGYGFSNLETGSAVNVDSLFQSGSVGKQFTAAAVMLLSEEGSLKLDDGIRSYFPEAPGHFSSMTVAHLLSHTSGIAAYPSKIDFQCNYSNDELLELIYEEPLVCEPGSCFEYSNSGYIILGYLIERVTGQFYVDFLTDSVFRPLRMDRAQVIDEREIVPGRVDGYERRGGRLQNSDWTSPAVSNTADGSLYLSVKDYAKWDAALADRRILSAETWDRLWTPGNLSNGKANPDNYGLGWYVQESDMGRYIDHSGDWQGFHNYAMRFVDHDIAIAVFTNLSPTAGTRPREMAHAILESVIQGSARSVQRIDDERPDLTRRHRSAFEDGIDLTKQSLGWDAGALRGERMLYLANMAADLARAGPLQEFYLTASEVDEGTLLRTYLAQYESTSYAARFRTSPHDRLLAIRVLPEPGSVKEQ